LSIELSYAAPTFYYEAIFLTTTYLNIRDLKVHTGVQTKDQKNLKIQ